MNNVAISPQMIYNVYQGGGGMRLTVSRWGNSLGIRIPTAVINALSLKNGDVVNYELTDNALVLKKEQSTKDLFEAFYGKPYENITESDLGNASELDWGEDVGGESF